MVINTPGAARVNLDPDTRLMLEVRDGDLERLGVLFERHHGRVHDFCYRMTRSEHAANDLVQETFLRILRYRASFRAEASFSTWLYRVARNLCLDHLQRLSRRSEAEEQWREEMGSDSSSPDPDVRRLQLVSEAFERLPLEGREVLILSRHQGLRYDEIAGVCDCSIGAVKVRVHRALKRLRALYLELERANGLRTGQGSVDGGSHRRSE